MASYADGSPAILISHPLTGEREAKASVWLDQITMHPPGHVFIKDYSENEGVWDALIKCGAITDSGVKVGVPSPGGLLNILLGVLCEDLRKQWEKLAETS